MKSSERRQSSNIEIDCLGERANADSLAAEAILACQDEVNKLRQAYRGVGGSMMEIHQGELDFGSAVSDFLYHEKIADRKAKEAGTFTPKDLESRFIDFKESLPATLIALKVGRIADGGIRNDPEK